MAARTKNRGLPRNDLTPDEEIAWLRSEVARLRSVVRKLEASPGDAARKARPAARSRKRHEAKAAAPALPPQDADGNFPATETLRAILAQQIIRRRQAAGWTQAQLAEHAGVRQETVSRIESGKNAPNVATVDKLDRALNEAGA
jgi:ribosome-binding protein aMBF1 (putative translation factor)